ncbi:BIP5 [Symbiodinium sp. CCMP2592]|nr:BIP5 [Symbiodinium sp. CCMP2592]
MAKRYATGDFLAIAGTLVSVMTVIIGLIYAAAKPPSFEWKWSDCPWSNPDEYTLWVDCNNKWQTSWGMTALPNYTALIIGIIGVAMYQPQTLEVVGFPRNMLQYGIWLIVQGFVGDFGYCGKLGVVTGYVSCILGVICIVASAFDIKSTRMRNIEKAYPMPPDTDDEDEIDAPAPRVAAGGPVAGAPSGSMGPNAVNALFDKLDTDGDGVLSAAELRSGGFR